jgi:hypothetical protein
MRYLFGDSTESELEFNYLAFLREVFDSAVVLLEAETTLEGNRDKRDRREAETGGLIRAVEELGKDALGLVEPVAKEQPKTPAGRAAASIAAAAREAVAHETAAAKAALGTARGEVDRDDEQVLARARGVLEKLLKAHDLPGAEKTLEATWANGPAKVTMRQKTGFGVEALIVLEATGGLFGADLRVERIAEGVEIHTHEAGGWLKKSDKLVAHKLGRYQVVGVTLAGGDVTIKLKEGSASLTITATSSGDIEVDGAGGKDYAVEDRDRAGIKALADKLGAAVRGLDQRTSLASVELDGKSLTGHGHPRVLAERLISAIAPTVQKIAKHSRNPDELVLRRLVAGGHREEVFVEVAELAKKLEPLPAAARSAFGPLQLPGLEVGAGRPRSGGTRPPPVELRPPVEVKAPAKPDEPKPIDVNPIATTPREHPTPVTTPIDRLTPPELEALPAPAKPTIPSVSTRSPTRPPPLVTPASEQTESDRMLAATIDAALDEK